MKKSNLTRKRTLKTFTPVSAVAAVCALAASSAHAQTLTSVFSYNFPASYNGTGTTITDQSAAGNNGTFDGTLSLSSSVPTGGTGQSLVTTSGGVLTSKTASLANSAIATAGGFMYDVSFMWNGTDSTSFGHTQKLIDYSGTESLQLVTTAGGTASLQMVFGSDTGVETIAASTTISQNTWYNVSLGFDTTGNSVVGGDITGTDTLSVNGSIVGKGIATKGTYGDGLNRPIGVGQLGANFGYLVGFKGDIYDPSVYLGVPEPSTLALGMMGGVGVLGMMWNARRRRA